MSKKQTQKRFKVFYFPNPNDPYFSKVEIITADHEVEAEAIFRSLYRDKIIGNELFFGWVEEMDA